MKQYPGTQENSRLGRGSTVAALALAAITVLATPCFADTAVASASGEPANAVVAGNEPQITAATEAVASVGVAPALSEVDSGAPSQSADALAPRDAEAPPQQPSPSGSSASELSAQQLAKQITNPVTDLWQLQFQFNNIQLESSDTPVSEERVNNLYFQPILPVKLTEKLNLITRPVFTLYNSVPVPTGPSTTHRQTKLGDTILAQVLSPAGTEPWIIAAGPTWIFPTAGSDETGQGKWQLGPALGGGYITDQFLAGALVQQWWSFAGDSDRKDTSQMAILPLLYRFYEGGWSVGYSGQVLADWKAPSGEKWTVPVGLSVGKVVKLGILPVQFQLGGQYFVERPTAGPEWNVQLQITPVIPRMIKGTLFHSKSS